MIAANRPKILCVDDEPNVIRGYRPHLRKHFTMTPAHSGSEGLEALEKESFSVVISDMRMPKMNGAEFLCKAREMAPHTVRLLLTGETDLKAAISAVNEGQIFRFLTKPCPAASLLETVQAAAEQHRLLTAEQMLLEQTLSGSVKVLTDVLSLSAPTVFSRATMLKRYVGHMSCGLGLKSNTWQYELAALLSQLGCISLPPDTIDRYYNDQPLTPDEREMLHKHPDAGSRLIENIPRLEVVAQIILRQNERNRNVEVSEKTPEETVEVGAALLRLAIDLDRLMGRGVEFQTAIQKLRQQKEHSPKLIDAIQSLQDSQAKVQIKAVTVRELQPLMVLDQDIKNTNGLVLVSKGTELSLALIQRLHNFSTGIGLIEPFSVQLPG